MIRKSACRQTLKVRYEPGDKWQEAIGQLREVDRRRRVSWAQDGMVKLLGQKCLSHLANEPTKIN